MKLNNKIADRQPDMWIPWPSIGIACQRFESDCLGQKTEVQPMTLTPEVTIYILIVDGGTFPMFPAHLQLYLYTCQRILCLLTWWHQQRLASHCFGKLWLCGEFTWPISSVHGSFGEHLGTPKIAHGRHNDVRCLCCPNLGCESPLAETPKGSLCWENLCGCVGHLVGGHWLGCMYIPWYSRVAASSKL